MLRNHEAWIHRRQSSNGVTIQGSQQSRADHQFCQRNARPLFPTPSSHSIRASPEVDEGVGPRQGAYFWCVDLGCDAVLGSQNGNGLEGGIHVMCDMRMGAFHWRCVPRNKACSLRGSSIQAEPRPLIPVRLMWIGPHPWVRHCTGSMGAGLKSPS